MIRKSLWILAHYDDEVMGLHLLADNNSRISHVVYLTDSVPSYAQFNSEIRKKECIATWNMLNPRGRISFFGEDSNLQDGNLHQSFNEKCFGELLLLAESIEFDEIVTVALEGGHQDHDVTSLIAERLAMLSGCPLILFPTYHALKNRIRPYGVMTSRNASVKALALSPARRLERALLSLRIIARYKSQSRTWIGLAPFIIFRYLTGTLIFEQFSEVKDWIQPDPTSFLYFNRNKCKIIDYKLIRLKLMSFGVNF